MTDTTYIIMLTRELCSDVRPETAEAYYTGVMPIREMVYFLLRQTWSASLLLVCYVVHYFDYFLINNF